jgi:hypothetical protein
VGVGFATVVGVIGSAVVVGTRLGVTGLVGSSGADVGVVACPSEVEAADGGSAGAVRWAANPAALPATPADRTVAMIAARVFMGGLLLGARATAAQRALHPT